MHPSAPQIRKANAARFRKSADKYRAKADDLDRRAAESEAEYEAIMRGEWVAS